MVAVGSWPFGFLSQVYHTLDALAAVLGLKLAATTVWCPRCRISCRVPLRKVLRWVAKGRNIAKCTADGQHQQFLESDDVEQEEEDDNDDDDDDDSSSHWVTISLAGFAMWSRDAIAASLPSEGGPASEKAITCCREALKAFAAFVKSNLLPPPAGHDPVTTHKKLAHACRSLHRYTSLRRRDLLLLHYLAVSLTNIAPFTVVQCLWQRVCAGRWQCARGVGFGARWWRREAASRVHEPLPLSRRGARHDLLD